MSLVVVCCMCASGIIAKRCWRDNIKVEFKEITKDRVSEAIHCSTKKKESTDGENTSGGGKWQKRRKADKYTIRETINRQAYKHLHVLKDRQTDRQMFVRYKEALSSVEQNSLCTRLAHQTSVLLHFFLVVRTLPLTGIGRIGHHCPPVEH